MKEIHKALGHDGMSSDETETEARGLVAKSIRQIPKAWLSEEIGQMWEAVETVGRATSQAVGNHQVQHIFSASTAGRSKARAVCGLPFNFYSDLWWKNLTEAQQHFLHRNSQNKLIPSKVCIVCNSMLLSFIQNSAGHVYTTGFGHVIPLNWTLLEFMHLYTTFILLQLSYLMHE